MTAIMGKSVATAEQMANHLLSKNPSPKIAISALHLAKLFLLIGEIEGVRGDLEFARSCWETAYFKFGGTVTPDQKNFCGHGTTSSTNKGSYFPDEFYSILVQIQHAKGYATAEALNYECLDTRYKYVKLGSAPNMEDMGGKWAVPGYDTKKYSSLQEAKDAKDSYGDKIMRIMDEILGTSSEVAEKEENVTEKPVEKPLEGKVICIDAGHAGKYNRCPAIPEYYESDMAWKLHLLQKKYLEDLGARVLLTRPHKDVDLALISRGKTARGCDLFISNHSNAVAGGMNENVDYVAVYHLTEDATAVCDDISEEAAKVLAPVIAGVMGTRQGYKVLTRKAESDRNGDGILNDNYYGVLNGARLVDAPGLILEHSFHTNSQMVRWLLNEDNLDRLAKAEAEAISRYLSNRDGVIAHPPFTIRIANVPAGDFLNIRKEPNANSEITGKLSYDNPHKYTIVEVKGGWGRLKSGIGWINLRYTVRA